MSPLTAEGARYFKQLDLELDGMSYCDFRRLYELGGNATATDTTTGADRVMAALPAAHTHSYRPAASDARDCDAEK